MFSFKKFIKMLVMTLTLTITQYDTNFAMNQELQNQMIEWAIGADEHQKEQFDSALATLGAHYHWALIIEGIGHGPEGIEGINPLNVYPSANEPEGGAFYHFIEGAFDELVEIDFPIPIIQEFARFFILPALEQDITILPNSNDVALAFHNCQNAFVGRFPFLENILIGNFPYINIVNAQMAEEFAQGFADMNIDSDPE